MTSAPAPRRLGLAALLLAFPACVLTDYGDDALSQCSLPGPPLESNALIDCWTSTAVAVTQNTLEPQAAAMLTTAGGGCSESRSGCGRGLAACVGQVPVLAGPPRATQVVGWARFLQRYAAFGESLVTGPPGCETGLWSMGGVKDLACDPTFGLDPGIRIANYYSPTPNGHFTCVGDGTLGPEGQVAGDAYGPGPGGGPVPHVPGLAWDMVAIDCAPGIQGCANIAALTPNRAACGLSTVFGTSGRVPEGGWQQAPVHPCAGLAEFFAGEPLALRHRDAELRVSGKVRDDGMLAVRVHSLAWRGRPFTPPRAIEVGVSRELRRFRFDWAGQEESVLALARWALEVGIGMDGPVEIGGFVPEVAAAVPALSFQLVRESIARWVEERAGTAPLGAPPAGD